RIDCFFRLFLSLGQGDDAHHLREICIACRADQQTADVATGLLRVRAEPWPCAITTPESAVLHNCRLRHALLHLPLAATLDFSQIAAGPAFIDPQPPSAIRLSPVNKGVLINVSN